MTKIKRKHLIIALFIGASLGFLENIAAQFVLDHYKWAESVGFFAFLILLLITAYLIKNADLEISS